MYYSHSPNGAGQPHLLRDHLHSVSAMAQAFAPPALAEHAKWAGLFHDLGKYRQAFQEYLRHERASSLETHHAIYGAVLAAGLKCPTLAFTIAGHHAGLHDLAQLRTFLADPRYRAAEELPWLLEQCGADLGPLVQEALDWREDAPTTDLGMRMVFSALCDADFLDTEAHFLGRSRTPLPLDPGARLQQLQAAIEAKSPTGPLNQLRRQIFTQCRDGGALPQGFFTLTVPTGGGKTFSSMAFALAHAQQHGLRRVVTILPYLSIIEQNASIYRALFDPEAQGILIEDHSAVEAVERDEQRSPLDYAADNWDAGVIVTTAVNFIESLFASRPSRCRKLHNIARAVLLFDEVQVLPTHLLNPLLHVLRDLQRNYGVSILFCTATQPAFRRSGTTLSEGLAPGEAVELAQDLPGLFAQLRRVRYHLPQPGATLAWDVLAATLAQEHQALCIVNLRRHAVELWHAVQSLGCEALHLSSSMCAAHRSAVLQDVRTRLDQGQRCLLISTQVVEAGVDVDFPRVWRAMGPLDSLAQAAGRCNREGRRAWGDVTIFRPCDPTLPPGIYTKATAIGETMLLSIPCAEALATDPSLFQRYFTRLYQYIPTDYQKPGECTIQEDRRNYRFRTVAQKARVIPDDTTPVIVPYGQAEAVVNDIRTTGRFTHQDLRRLQRYLVALRPPALARLQTAGRLTPLLPGLELSIAREETYDNQLGLQD